MHKQHRLVVVLSVLLPLSAVAATAQSPASRITMSTGTTFVQTLSAVGAERESLHRVRLASDSGLHYEWTFQEVHENGDTLRREHRYFEAVVDLATAFRIRFFHAENEPEAHPGYTMHALSRATYRRMREGRPDSLQVMYLDRGIDLGPLGALGIAGSGRGTPIRWRGTIAPAAPRTVPFPVLLNGRRVELRALHLKGDFTARQGRWQPQLWVLADSAYPMILKWVGAYRETGNVLQTTRIDLPMDPGIAERELSTSCRAELAGIYFGFNSALLAPASDDAIASIAGILARHPDWTATLEGHTDSIGSAAANRTLSERRVAAVRARLIERHKLNPARLKVAGHGAARPRETNATIEGRARNRRVELVRDCPDSR
jgi:outer membrane protein OmpA-like peptidoglycan-associated protein